MRRSPAIARCWRNSPTMRRPSICSACFCATAGNAARRSKHSKPPSPQRRGRAAWKAFKNALKLAPADGETHYNEGVALQMLHRRGLALRAYQRALALSPELIAADFNIGVIFREQGRAEAAISAFEHVLARDPRHVAAHKALAETLLGAGRIDG